LLCICPARGIYVGEIKIEKEIVWNDQIYLKASYDRIRTEMKRIRIVLCGEASVGKSSIISRFSTGTFQTMTNETIAGAFHCAKVRFNGETLVLEIWDTAGSERYHSVIPSFFRNAAAVVIVYDITARDSFTNVDYWLEFTKTNSPEGVQLFLVGNKVDLFDLRVVTFDEGRALTETHKLSAFAETSAKTGEFVDSLFALLAAVPPSGTVDADIEGRVISLDKNKCC
jgi:small GTP-binding protein